MFSFPSGLVLTTAVGPDEDEGTVEVPEPDEGEGAVEQAARSRLPARIAAETKPNNLECIITFFLS